jgi:pimeloyl-ACP methyl ester carboxylesterase
VTQFPEPRYVELPGLSMAIHEHGPGDGVPVILCHGWPEIAYSWRHQVSALGDAGYRVIAPDMRGYGGTVGPKGPQAVPLYDMIHLTGDLVHLLDALDLERAIFVGHDWGGAVVWQMPLHHPARVAGVIGVNTAFIPRTEEDPLDGLRAKYGDDMYMLRFQEFGLAEAAFERDTGRSLRFIHRRSPVTQANWAQRPSKGRGLALLSALERPEKDWPGTDLHTDEELAIFRAAFERSGWEGGVNWYRNISRNWALGEELPRTIEAPCLMIFAENDVVLPPSQGDGMEDFIGDLEKHVIAGCGHWTQTEAPEKLNALMLDWLNRRFGPRGPV